MQVYFLIALIFAVMVAVFAIQNATPVHIQFLFWEIPNISQVLVIFGAAIVGALIALLISISKQIRLLWQVRQLTQENTRLKNECRQLRQSTGTEINTPEKIPAKEEIKSNDSPHDN